MGSFAFKLPDIGEGIAEAEIAEWRVEVGADVAEDDPLVDMMTDKATVELTSPVSGRVVSRTGARGDLIATGSVLVLIETADSSDVAVPAPADAGFEPVSVTPVPAARVETQSVAALQVAAPVTVPSAPVPPAPPSTNAAVATVTAHAADHDMSQRVSAAPAVRQRADELGIDLNAVVPTSPNGRVRHSDLDAYMAYSSRMTETRLPAHAAPGARRTGVEAVKVIGLRRRIAERMAEASRRIPHFSYIEEVDVTDLEATRAHLNAVHGKERGKLTVLPFIVRALTEVLPRYPQINARFDDEAGVVDRHEAVHVGIATQTPAGLVVPVLSHAESRGIWDNAAEIARLAEAARSGKATAAELGGSTITISSLGPSGGVATTPVINMPEVAIVGVNKIVERAVVRDGVVAVRKVMNVSCSFDHRVVDGYDAAEFVQAVRRALEHPAALFAS